MRVRTFIYALLQRTVGEQVVGVTDYFRLPSLRGGAEQAFNGQAGRRQIFETLLAALDFTAVVETGAYRGTTTAYLHQASGRPVFTVEHHPRYYGYVRTRFFRTPAVQVHYGDSRAFLRRLAADPALVGQSLFLYLDAHWGDELPLAEEIDIVFRAWPDAVIMIDDFAVPGGAGYGYDDYGPGKRLDVNYLAHLPFEDLALFFPARPATEETGRRRGCVVVARDPSIVAHLAAAGTLVQWRPATSPTYTVAVENAGGYDGG